MLFLEYPKCSTCQKAKKWLDDHGIAYEDRHIKEQNPSAEELKAWHEKSGFPLKNFLIPADALQRNAVKGQTAANVRRRAVCIAGNGRYAGETTGSGGGWFCADRI